MAFRLHTTSLFFFFFNDTATTEIYTLSLHDALPIYHRDSLLPSTHRSASHSSRGRIVRRHLGQRPTDVRQRSEEHTSELQSRLHLVCRLLLEKKKHQTNYAYTVLMQAHAHNNTRATH